MNADGGPTGITRTREGYVEIIEMGTVTNDHQATLNAITHDSRGVPSNCAQLVEAWTTGGYWNANAATDIGVPTGGLYGVESIINVAEGLMYTINATAIIALVLFPDGVTNVGRERIASFALQHRLPTVSGWDIYALAGGLVTFGGTGGMASTTGHQAYFTSSAPNLGPWQSSPINMSTPCVYAPAASIPAVEQPRTFASGSSCLIAAYASLSASMYSSFGPDQKKMFGSFQI